MTKSDLVARVLTAYPYMHLKDVEKVVSVIIDLIIDKLKKGGRVELRDFGSFSTRERKEIHGRNPKNGEKVVIQAKRVPFFKAGKRLKDSLNSNHYF